MNDISPLEMPPKQRHGDPRTTCWDCHDRPRAIVFLPNDRGSYLSAKCEQCAKAPAVLERLEANR